MFPIIIAVAIVVSAADLSIIVAMVAPAIMDSLLKKVTVYHSLLHFQVPSTVCLSLEWTFKSAKCDEIVADVQQ